MKSPKILGFPLPSAFVRRHVDAVAVLVLVALTAFAASWDLLGDKTILGMDAATQYYPFYYFLGESLRSGNIPAWNPYQFSGTPFAADPLSGWTYLPAMLLFTFLPLVDAIKGYIFLHLLLAGLSTYTLARVLGMGASGAFLAAVAYEFSGFLYVDNACCFQYIGVMVWLPLAVLGAELGIRSPRWLGRGSWWGLSGLALSQMLASWFGQGSSYALLALGGYVAYRTLLFPPHNVRSIRARVAGFLLHGCTVLVFGFCLAAAGLLPRLEYNALSDLAGGYPAGIRSQGGWSIGDWVLLAEPGLWYAGITILILALVAPLIAQQRFAVPYFATLTLCTLVLSGQGTTPLHSALYLLPYFEWLHPHNPERVMVIFYLGAALLAGAALTVLGKRAGGRKRSLLLTLLPFLAAFLLAAVVTLFPPESGGWVTLYPPSPKNDVSVPVGSLLFLMVAVALVAAYVLLPRRFAAWRTLAFALLALVVFADLFVADRVTISEQDFSWWGWIVKIRKMDLAEYYAPSGAARFLQSKGEEEPFRYFGYDPELGDPEGGSHVSSPARFTEPTTQALEANGRSMLLGLQNIQGYNPTQIARYDEYMKALNGDEQNYHFIDVYEGGLDSPLINLLNVRYVIVPSLVQEENRRGFQHSLRRFEQFERTHAAVYEDDQTKVLENPEALPRAWIVHSAQQERPEKSLELLSSGEVDPKQTALLEDAPPEMSQPDDASAERASVTEYGANRIRLETDSGAPGLLVLSEVYYPAWKAYVDGRSAPVYATDYLLRSVPIPAGEHTVELRYESWSLRMGIVISLVTLLALIALAVASRAQHWWNSRTVSKPRSF